MYIYRKPEKQIMPVEENSIIKTVDFDNVFRTKVYTEAMNKYFDKTDDMTRNILLAVNEADQNVVLTSLSNKLYNHIVEKVDEIDFGTIPTSKGDITKIQNYNKLNDCINIISEILQNYHQDTSSIETVNMALQNMIDRTDMFTRAYKFNTEMPMIIYNTIALSIVSSISYMISACIEFVKISDTEGFDIALNNTAAVKTKDCILFKDLEKFNHLCAKGDFDKAMDFVIKQNTKNFTGGIGAIGVSAVLGIVLIIIPLIRELIFFFYYSRVKVSEYFDAQAALLTINAYNIENNLSREVDNKKEVVKKQRKIADLFKKISNAIAIKSKTGQNKADKEIATLDKEKFKSNDVLDSIPDSANSVLF